MSSFPAQASPDNSKWAALLGFTVQMFIDGGKSAWTENLKRQPAFLEMIEAARAGEINTIVVTHLDRFSRKLLITLTVLGELGKQGIGFVNLENPNCERGRIPQPDA